MISTKSSGSLAGAGVFAAIAASLCCVTPLIALLAGSSSIASNFSWIEPARPYLIGLSIAVLAFAWYVKLKHTKTNNMNCCVTSKKPSFFQSKFFLGIITVFAFIMMRFPLYAKIFSPKQKAQTTVAVQGDTKKQVTFNLEGMSCKACENHVNNELAKVKGVLNYKTSYAQKNAVVTFDKSKVDIVTIESAINTTGYKVKGSKMSASTTVANAETKFCCKKTN